MSYKHWKQFHLKIKEHFRRTILIMIKFIFIFERNKHTYSDIYCGKEYKYGLFGIYRLIRVCRKTNIENAVLIVNTIHTEIKYIFNSVQLFFLYYWTQSITAKKKWNAYGFLGRKHASYFFCMLVWLYLRCMVVQ